MLFRGYTRVTFATRNWTTFPKSLVLQPGKRRPGTARKKRREQGKNETRRSSGKVVPAKQKTRTRPPRRGAAPSRRRYDVLRDAPCPERRRTSERQTSFRGEEAERALCYAGRRYDTRVDSRETISACIRAWSPAEPSEEKLDGDEWEGQASDEIRDFSTPLCHCNLLLPFFFFTLPLSVTRFQGPINESKLFLEQGIVNHSLTSLSRRIEWDFFRSKLVFPRNFCLLYCNRYQRCAGGTRKGPVGGQSRS